MRKYCERCTTLRLGVRGGIPLPSKELLAMRAILSSTVAFAVVDVDVVQAISVDNKEFVIATAGV